MVAREFKICLFSLLNGFWIFGGKMIGLGIIGVYESHWTLSWLVGKEWKRGTGTNRFVGDRKGWAKGEQAHTFSPLPFPSLPSHPFKGTTGRMRTFWANRLERERGNLSFGEERGNSLSERESFSISQSICRPSTRSQGNSPGKEGKGKDVNFPGIVVWRGRERIFTDVILDKKLFCWLSMIFGDWQRKIKVWLSICLFTFLYLKDIKFNQAFFRQFPISKESRIHFLQKVA